MQTAIDIAERMVPRIFAAISAAPPVGQAIARLCAADAPGSSFHRAGHVIDAAGYSSRSGEIMFDGEFDFHAGRHGDEHGHRALRANVAGVLRRRGRDWEIAGLSVESVELVDGTDQPDRLPDESAATAGFRIPPPRC
ncbi:MAG: hypothetical protein V4505_01185 [Pseudomonadota bacterium]